jgi:hypothetical protein
MKQLLATASLSGLMLISTNALANGCTPTTTTVKSDDPGIFLGITYAFGSKEGLGFTLQMTSSRRDDRGVVAAGVSYYPSSGMIGVPVGVGYQKSHTLVLGGYDILLGAPVIHGGYTNTSKDRVVAESCPPI